METEKLYNSTLWERPPEYLKVWSYLIAESDGESVSTTPQEVSAATCWFSGNKYNQLKNNQVNRILNFLEAEHYIKIKKNEDNLDIKIRKFLNL